MQREAAVIEGKILLDAPTDVDGALAEVRLYHAPLADALSRTAALTRGCPWFRSGVSYALERLRLYLTVDADKAYDFELHDPVRLDGWKRRYHRTLRRLDTTELFTAFHLGPLSPPVGEAE